MQLLAVYAAPNYVTFFSRKHGITYHVGYAASVVLSRTILYFLSMSYAASCFDFKMCYNFTTCKN